MSGWGGEDKWRRGGRGIEVVEVYVWAREEESVFFYEGLEALCFVSLCICVDGKGSG